MSEFVMCLVGAVFSTHAYFFILPKHYAVPRPFRLLSSLMGGVVADAFIWVERIYGPVPAAPSAGFALRAGFYVGIGAAMLVFVALLLHQWRSAS